MTKAQRVLMFTDHTKEVTFNCKHHGDVTGTAFLIGNSYNEPACPKCIEEKNQEHEDYERNQELQRQKKLTQARLVEALIPERFKHHSFETYKAEDELQQERKQTCLTYANEFNSPAQKGQCMILCGKPGTGKTHLACAIAKHVVTNHNATAMFMKTLKATRAVKETYSKDSEIKEQQAINNFVRPDLLILDEVGVQFGSDAEKMILFEIINERYEALKSTIMISNLNAKDLTDFVGERVIDRFKENGGKLLRFDWKSYRIN